MSRIVIKKQLYSIMLISFFFNTSHAIEMWDNSSKKTYDKVKNLKLRLGIKRSQGEGK